MILLPQRAHTASSSEGYHQSFVPLTRDRRRWNGNGRQAVGAFRPVTISDAALEGLGESRKENTHRQLVLSRPFGPLLFHDRL